MRGPGTGACGEKTGELRPYPKRASLTTVVPNRWVSPRLKFRGPFTAFAPNPARLEPMKVIDGAWTVDW